MRTLRIALAQIDCCVGDLAGNRRKILETVAAAKAAGAHIVVFPELAVTGYPPEDLLFRPQFIADNIATLNGIAASVPDICAIIGFVDRREIPGRKWCLYNAAAVTYGGRVAGIYRKHLLPNYGVFDEARYFTKARRNVLFRLGALDLGVTVCEDIWYPDGPARDQAAAGAQVLINISASPYHMHKGSERERMIADRATSYRAFLVYCNLVGGQDELVFDGHSVVYGADGALIARGRQFEEDLIAVDLDPQEAPSDPGAHAPTLPVLDLGGVLAPSSDLGPRNDLTDGPSLTLEGIAKKFDLTRERIRQIGLRAEAKLHAQSHVHPVLGDLDEIWAALCTGVRGYVRKNGFARVVLGLSGGVDSALVACIAADALGPESVTCVYMPSEYSSTASGEDASALATNLGVDYREIPISGTFGAYKEMLKEAFAKMPQDITEENLQARIRGNILMALSNKLGWLVLTTGNKSEMACGYATLYGDMAGGFAVLKDVPKTLVYRLARRVNERAGRPLIPERIITRPPTAELRPDQTDQDTLPPYDILDPILDAYIDEDMAPRDIAALGYDLETVLRVVRMVDRSEYKRRQAPPGVKITTRAFGRDRRLPITNRYGG